MRARQRFYYLKEIKKEWNAISRSLADRIRNEKIHRMAIITQDVMVKMKKNVLSRLGHVERMSDERMTKKICDGKVSGKRGRRPGDLG